MPSALLIRSGTDSKVDDKNKGIKSSGTIHSASPSHPGKNVSAKFQKVHFQSQQGTGKDGAGDRSRSLDAGFDFARIGILQPKLKVGLSHDAYEQEADSMAEQAMTSAESGIPLPSKKTNDQPRISDIGRKISPSDLLSVETSDRVANHIQSVRARVGSSLDPSTRAFMEPLFGYNFGNVVVHTDDRAAASARSMNALAYTVGNDIIFGEGQYQPNQTDGRRLLAHELTHVVQQRNQKDGISNKVQRYESGEHAQAGSTSHKVTINGVTMDEGDLVALGDFFEDPKEIYAAPATELQKLVDLIERDKKAYTGVGGVKPVTNAEWADATKGRPKNKQYLELAKRNDTHFAPHADGRPGERGDNKAEWRKWHEQALMKTIEYAASGKTGVPDEAVVINGFAAHFLTDAFSAGHIVNKDDAMEASKTAWKTQKFDGTIFKESDFTRKVAAQVLADPKVSAIMAKKQLKMVAWDAVTTQRFSEFIYQMADSKPDLFFNAFGRLIHDQLNESINDSATAVEVTNKRGDPPWKLSGDETLGKSPDTLKVMQAAVAQSYANLESVAKLGKSPASLESYFSAVWDYTPIPTAAGKKKVDAVIATFTDPKNSKTIDAFAQLAIKQIATLVEELTAQGYMRDTPPPMPPPPRDYGPKY